MSCLYRKVYDTLLKFFCAKDVDEEYLYELPRVSSEDIEIFRDSAMLLKDSDILQHSEILSDDSFSPNTSPRYLRVYTIQNTIQTLGIDLLC